jgi:ppGpp synthetase/RelA/SpoT-type nucleotidyltranferase
VTWVVGIVVFLIGIGVRIVKVLSLLCAHSTQAGLSDMAGVRILHEFYCEIDNRIPYVLRSPQRPRS